MGALACWQTKLPAAHRLPKCNRLLKCMCEINKYLYLMAFILFAQNTISLFSCIPIVARTIIDSPPNCLVFFLYQNNNRNIHRGIQIKTFLSENITFIHSSLQDMCSSANLSLAYYVLLFPCHFSTNKKFRFFFLRRKYVTCISKYTCPLNNNSCRCRWIRNNPKYSRLSLALTPLGCLWLFGLP